MHRVYKKHQSITVDFTHGQALCVPCTGEDTPNDDSNTIGWCYHMKKEKSLAIAGCLMGGIRRRIASGQGPQDAGAKGCERRWSAECMSVVFRNIRTELQQQRNTKCLSYQQCTRCVQYVSNPPTYAATHTVMPREKHERDHTRHTPAFHAVELSRELQKSEVKRSSSTVWRILGLHSPNLNNKRCLMLMGALHTGTRYVGLESRLWVSGVFVGGKLIMSLLLRMRCCRTWEEIAFLGLRCAGLASVTQWTKNVDADGVCERRHVLWIVHNSSHSNLYAITLYHRVQRNERSYYAAGMYHQ